MARPRTFDTDQALDQILDVFWTKGFGDTSIQDLCEATGLRPASLYAAYGNKDDLFLAAASKYLKWLEGETDCGLSGMAALRFAMNRVVEVTLADPRRRGCPLLNSIAELHSIDKRGREIVQASLDRMKAFFEHHLKIALGSGVRPARRKELGALLLAASVSVRVLGRLGESEQVLRSIALGALNSVKAEMVET